MYVHDLDPFAIQISGDFGIRWYGLSYMAGFIIAYLLISWLVQRQRAGLTQAMVSDFITYAAIGTLVGGRLGYVVFYAPDLILKFKGSFPFWGVLAVNEGGMASHGGIIGIVIASILFARKHGINSAYLLDLASITGPIGVLMGRIANFVNGELVGREAPPQFQYAVKFPSDIFNWPAQDFSRLESLQNVVENLGLTKDQWLEWLSQYQTQGSARDQVFQTLSRIVTEIQSGNSALKQSLEPLLLPRYPSQLIAAALEGLLTFLVLFFLWRKPRKPGFIAACFVMFYAVVRVINEQFRMPDAHIGFQALGLTRGQWLSVAMFVLGVLMMIIWSRSSAITVNGWSKGHSIKLGRK